jgi:hypothetical protein
MFRVTIEIVPFGDETKKRTLYRIDGANIGTNAFDHADYGVTSVSEKGTVKLEIENFNRKEGILKLTKKIVKMLIKKEEKGNEGI